MADIVYLLKEGAKHPGACGGAGSEVGSMAGVGVG